MQRILQYLDRVENIALVWTILSLALIGFVQVIARYVFNYSFTWYEELGRYLGVFIAFLGASIGVKTGSHFTMDLVVSKMGQPLQGLVKGLTNILSALFFFTVAWYSWKIVLRMHGYETTSPTMEIPMYIAYLPIPVFSIVIGIRFVAKAVEFLRGLNQEAIR
ncbi:MAG TPA: TRAP transporter small permease [Desulfobacteraceae bacterium]|nr:TRAP transporter small permease [Desulfobacteraceae bacterium]